MVDGSDRAYGLSLVYGCLTGAGVCGMVRTISLTHEVMR